LLIASQEIIQESEEKSIKRKELKNIVIAAGYATRLGELTRNFPKPLLQIGQSTILGRMLDDIDRIDSIDEHIIVTNHKFASIFED
jgi:glucose-1-phosphate thymidylyltransferase